MNWRKVKLHLSHHWSKYVLGIFLSVLVLPLTLLVFSLAMPWVLYPQLDYYQKQQYHIQLSIVGFWSVMSAGVFVVGLYWLHYGGGMMQMGKRKVKQHRVNVKWDDVIGMTEAKQEAWEVVQLLKDRALLHRIGGKILKGLLLTGPPGCGKTYLAKAIATESGVPFLSISGSEFVEIFVGVGPSRVRKIFKQARQQAEIHGGCIIFIDELDAVGQQRTADLGFGARTESNNTVNALLVEMDGLTDKDANIVVIAATNAPENTLDAALLRPGRFDRKLYVDVPRLDDRTKLFQYFMQKTKCDPAIDVGHLARRAVGRSPADIENIIKEAALIAARYKREEITFKDFSEALERVDLGFKMPHKFNKDERRRVAYHESGHLIATYMLLLTDDVFKASIVPRRGGTGGVVWHGTTEDLNVLDRDRAMGNVKVSLAGYVAEKMMYGSASSGVGSDFRSAMSLATQMVWSWGMGSNGFIGDYTCLLDSWQFRGSAAGSQLSDRTKEQLNEETQRLLNECLKHVEELLKKERPLLDRFVDELMKKDELEYDEIEAIFVEFGKARSTPSTLPPPEKAPAPDNAPPPPPASTT